MVENGDIWRAADVLVKRHGAEAQTVAAQRADELLAQGDMDEWRIWKRIFATIHELQRSKAVTGGRPEIKTEQRDDE